MRIAFHNREWQARAGVPAIPGWYYIETNTPFEILSRQMLWARQYRTKKENKLARVKNYDINSRCSRFDDSLSDYWNIRRVYSGFAANLQSRARDHTFSDPGTAGLALAKYPELHEFDWHFCYRTFNEFMSESIATEMLLLLGEQIWRSQNGWPILCAR